MKSKKEKKCPCGRIITDPKNKTGLCPRCQRKANGVAVGAGVAGIGLGVKKFAPRVLNGLKIILKK